jgi:hypothetical protein
MGSKAKKNGYEHLILKQIYSSKGLLLYSGTTDDIAKKQGIGK